MYTLEFQPQTTQTVIVTGAAGGMGRATCLYLAKLGWHVLAIDHNQTRLQQYLSEKDFITPLNVELSSAHLLERVHQALEALPPLWGLVNLAGISIGDSIERLSEQDWQTSFDINVSAPYRLIQGTYARMQAQNNGGSIVNVCSPVGYIGARKPSYSASKAAMHGLTMSCARNLGAYNIRVNLLLPGPTITEMTNDWSEQRRQAIAKECFLNRLCQPQEIAEGIAFLLSQHSRYMSASVLDMTCGSMWGH